MQAKSLKPTTVTRIAGFESGHDISYCVMENGIPVICEEEERISRVKMKLGDGLKLFFERYKHPENINYFAFGNWGSRKGDHAQHCKDEESEKKMQSLIEKNKAKLYEFGHHLCHAANAFYTSEFDEALIVTMDGGGHEDDKTETAFTISTGRGNKIKRIKTYKDSQINLGGMWGFLTYHVFGLSVGPPIGDQAGSVMSMAALGDAKYTYLFDNYKANLKKLKLIASICEKEKFNVAASLQEYTENQFRKAVKNYISRYTNLCLSGGVSLNCVLLGKIRNWFPGIKNIFCDPVPYDAGLALGAARYLWHNILDNPRIKNNIQNMSPYLGRLYSEKEIRKACGEVAHAIKIKKTNDLEVLDKISDQKIVAVFGGGSEAGRRALGNRSILADPRNHNMKSIINERVKHRHWYRPLAPSILEESLPDWFQKPILSPYMSFAIRFKIEKHSQVPAVVNYNGNGRLHTVNKELCPWFHSFLTEWEKISNVPILVNTSFNDSEPIVETPKNALVCFLKTNLDYLYFFDYGILVSKRERIYNSY